MFYVGQNDDHDSLVTIDLKRKLIGQRAFPPLTPACATTYASLI